MTEKPPHGAPCNRCGWCCTVQVCALALVLFGDDLPCPAVRPDGCGLVVATGDYVRRRDAPLDDLRDGARAIIGADLGCDARLPDEVPDYAFWRRLAAWARRHEARARRALRAWRSARR